MDVIESLAGMISSMLEFPLVGFLGGLVPAGGSEAGHQVATAVGTGLDNLGSLCSQAGLDRWELLGLAVLSAITVYRKELSSNSVYNGKEAGDTKGRGDHQHIPVANHVCGCNLATYSSQATSGTVSCDDSSTRRGKLCTCARVEAVRRQRAYTAKRTRAKLDERELRRRVEGRMRSLNLPVNHLQQLRASVDASWSSLSTAWEARRARGSGARNKREESAEGVDDERRVSSASDGFVMPHCSHAHPPMETLQASKGGDREQVTKKEGCVECAALAAARAVAASILGNDDGTVGLLPVDDTWASSSLGALPVDTLNKSLGYLAPQDLLALAKVSTGAREVADSDMVWRETWQARFGGIWESGICRDAAKRWHLHGWCPESSDVPQGWKVFFSEFEATWLDWIAAGQNSEASCLLGVFGRLYDITGFMHRHPGSPETLMDNAGADATEFFEDVGHSLDARELMKSLDSLAPRTNAPASTSQAFSASRGACILSSVVHRLRKEREIARQEGLALRRRAALARTAGGTQASTGPAASSQGETMRDAHEFVCEDCEGVFEPTALDRDGESGRDLRKLCSHVSGSLRVFYSPLRAEWGGFYSCCRHHDLLLH